MSIPIERERGDYGGALENCCVCRARTPMWTAQGYGAVDVTIYPPPQETTRENI